MARPSAALQLSSQWWLSELKAGPFVLRAGEGGGGGGGNFGVTLFLFLSLSLISVISDEFLSPTLPVCLIVPPPSPLSLSFHPTLPFPPLRLQFLLNCVLTGAEKLAHEAEAGVRSRGGTCAGHGQRKLLSTGLLNFWVRVSPSQGIGVARPLSPHGHYGWGRWTDQSRLRRKTSRGGGGKRGRG